MTTCVSSGVFEVNASREQKVFTQPSPVRHESVSSDSAQKFLINRLDFKRLPAPTSRAADENLPLLKLAGLQSCRLAADADD